MLINSELNSKLSNKSYEEKVNELEKNTSNMNFLVKTFKDKVGKTILDGVNNEKLKKYLEAENKWQFIKTNIENRTDQILELYLDIIM